MRKLVIGDICGEIDLLKRLMDRIVPTAEDYFLFTGSYLGPGKDSKAVLDYLIDFKEKFSCNFLQGCYETIFAQVVTNMVNKKSDKHLMSLWKSMNGDKVLKSYAAKDDFKVVFEGGKLINFSDFSMPIIVPETHIRFLEKELHLWYLDHSFPFVAYHAGPDTKSWQNPKQESVLLGEKGWWESKFRIPGINIVFGHIPFEKPFVAPGKRGIYLGAGQGRDKLCAWNAEPDEFIVVSS